MRYELTDHEWAAIRPMLPNKPRGVPRVNDRRVLNTSFGCCGPGRRGGTCRRTTGLTRPATIASSAGGELPISPARSLLDYLLPIEPTSAFAFLSFDCPEWAPACFFPPFRQAGAALVAPPPCRSAGGVW